MKDEKKEKSICELLGISDSRMETLVATINSWKTSSDEFDGMWFGYGQLDDCTNIGIPSLKKIMKLFRDKKIVYYTRLFDFEGQIAGSGYVLDDNFKGKSWPEIKGLLNGK